MNLFNKKVADEKLRLEIGEFAHANKNLLIIIADPKDDTIYVTYKDKFVSGRIKTSEGGRVHLVSDVLNASVFHKEIDRFLMSIMETLQIRRMTAGLNNFLQFIDGALFNLSMRHRGKSPTAAPKSEVEKGAIKSPFFATAEVDPEK